MELPSKLLEQIALDTRPKVDEHVLIVMDKSTHEEHLSQPFQTNNKQFKLAVTFLSVYNGIFNVTNSNNKFYFKKSITDQNDFFTIPLVAYEVESLNEETEGIIIAGDHFTESHYPFLIKPKFSILGSIIEIQQQGPLIGFVFNDGIGNLLGFD